MLFFFNLNSGDSICTPQRQPSLLHTLGTPNHRVSLQTLFLEVFHYLGLHVVGYKHTHKRYTRTLYYFPLKLFNLAHPPNKVNINNI